MNAKSLGAVLALAGLLILLAGLPGVPLQASTAASSVVVLPLNVWYGRAPVVDGVIAPGEYGGAHVIQFPGYGGPVIVYVRHDTANVFFAFDLPDKTPYPYFSGGGPGPAMQLFLDTNNDKAAAPQTDDYRFTVDKGNNAQTRQGTGSGWGPPVGAVDWSGAASPNATGWHAEFRVGFGVLGLTPGTPKAIGLALANVWTRAWPHDFYWPEGGDWLQPNTWGEAFSTESWTSWYYKPGDWPDYAPSGVPDFDQKQDTWGPLVAPPQWTYCGPVAAANSLWWFDSKFEPEPLLPAATALNDHYPLVYSYDPADQWDDHWPGNVEGGTPAVEFVDNLAGYFQTSPMTGTNVFKMYDGLQRYLYDRGLYDDYMVTLAEQPPVEWVQEEVLHSEDVILLLGFWQEAPTGGYFQRVGGHYVTLAGVDPVGGQFALSDPFFDFAEAVGPPWPGRVLNGVLFPHQPIPHPGNVILHNDAGNVSHDAYTIMPVALPIPGGGWGLLNYPPPPVLPDYLLNFQGVNPHPLFPSVPYVPGPPVFTVVEFAITVSPFDWKPGGWKDYAPSCMPDLNQKQGGWSNPLMSWTHCGPVATANSLWWFDSKFEPDPAPPSATLNNDHYALVQTYAPPTGIPWDDHWPLNVERNGATPSVELVDDLAQHMGTNMIVAGTPITGLVDGTIDYIAKKHITPSYSVVKVYQPEWDWVVDEVLRCEDVVLLLGFWTYDAAEGKWRRSGGHYVTVAGVDPNAGLVGLSDPYVDQAELGWPWLGRFWPPRPEHPPDTGVPEVAHNDAGVLSHDAYHAAPSPSPGGKWQLADYPGGTIASNFMGLNGFGPDRLVPGAPPAVLRVYTEVEWAMAVSPLKARYLPLVLKNY